MHESKQEVIKMVEDLQGVSSPLNWDRSSWYIRSCCFPAAYPRQAVGKVAGVMKQHSSLHHVTVYSHLMYYE